MPDADDFDVEELRRLLRGEGPKPPAAAPQAMSSALVSPKAPQKAAQPASGRKAQSNCRRKQT